MDHSSNSIVATQFRQACIDFNINNKRKIRSLTAVLELTALSLARSETTRYNYNALQSLHLGERTLIDSTQNRSWRRPQALGRSAQTLARSHADAALLLGERRRVGRRRGARARRGLGWGPARAVHRPGQVYEKPSGRSPSESAARIVSAFAI
jgi:hypothetical protein